MPRLGDIITNGLSRNKPQRAGKARRHVKHYARSADMRYYHTGFRIHLPRAEGAVAVH